jgi:hypothetical protein
MKVPILPVFLPDTLYIPFICTILLCELLISLLVIFLFSGLSYYSSTPTFVILDWLSAAFPELIYKFDAMAALLRIEDLVAVLSIWIPIIPKVPVLSLFLAAP